MCIPIHKEEQPVFAVNKAHVRICNMMYRIRHDKRALSLANILSRSTHGPITQMKHNTVLTNPL